NEMTHTYTISGMTCEGCVAKVNHLLKQLPEVTNVSINLEKGEAEIEMSKHIATPALQEALKDYPKYKLTEQYEHHTPRNIFDELPPVEEKKSWMATYKPILLIFGYITLISLIAGTATENFSWMMFMRIFMAGFFLTFSFFKMLDL